MARQLFCEALKISLGVTICAEAMTFSKVTNFSKMTSLLGVKVLFAKGAYSARNIYVKSAGIEYASTKGADIKVTSTKNACIRDTLTYTGGANIGA